MEYLREEVLLTSIVRDYAYSTEQYHHHPGYEIYFLNEGERDFVCAGQGFTLHEGEVFLAKPGVLHYASGQGRHQKYGIEFTEKYISRYLTPTARLECLSVFERNHIILREEEVRQFRRVYEDTLESFCAEPREDELCFTGILVMLGILRKSILRQEEVWDAAEQLPAEAEGSLGMVLTYIRANYAKINSLETVAGECYINKFYLSRSFKRHMGMTVMEYIHMLRMEQACELLVKTGLSIGEIAESCGYVNKSHFSTLFKKNMGESPAAFRKARQGFRSTSDRESRGRGRTGRKERKT